MRQPKDKWYYIGVAIFSLPFVVTLGMFVWAYQIGIFFEFGFWSGVVISALITFLFIGNNLVKLNSGRISDKNFWVYGLYGLFLWGFYEKYPFNQFIQTFVVPVIPICLVSLTLKAMYKDRVLFFKNKPKRKPYSISDTVPYRLTATTEGDDYPWIGGVGNVIREPYQKIFIRGFKHDFRLLSKLILNFSEGQNLLLYALYEPQKGVFDSTIKYAQDNKLHFKIMKSRYGDALALACNDIPSLEFLFSKFWVNEYIFWMVCHNQSFTNIIEVVNRTLSPDTLQSSKHTH